MKILNGSELAGFVKERQAAEVRMLRAGGLNGQKIIPKLVIIRDSDNPVITKYVELKKRYGEDIGVEVEDWLVRREADEEETEKNRQETAAENLAEAIRRANADQTVHGIIVQLPLNNPEQTDEIVQKIAPEKDVDGLSGKGNFDSATATAINWLLAGHGIELDGKKIALVGRGRLVGAPLYKMWTDSRLSVTMLHSGDDLSQLRDYDVVVTATGVPHLIKPEMIRPGAVVVDAGTTSEDGAIVGDVDEAVRERDDLAAITPTIGGVGPLTVGVLFENVITAAKQNS